MKILDSFRLPARVKGCPVDTGAHHTNTTSDSFYDPYIQYPVHYKVRVQICLLRFIWVTIWSVTVALEDGNAAQEANKHAIKIANTLNCTGL